MYVRASRARPETPTPLSAPSGGCVEGNQIPGEPAAAFSPGGTDRSSLPACFLQGAVRGYDVFSMNSSKTPWVLRG